MRCFGKETDAKATENFAACADSMLCSDHSPRTDRRAPRRSLSRPCAHACSGNGTRCGAARSFSRFMGTAVTVHSAASRSIPTHSPRQVQRSSHDRRGPPRRRLRTPTHRNTWDRDGGEVAPLGARERVFEIAEQVREVLPGGHQVTKDLAAFLQHPVRRFKDATKLDAPCQGNTSVARRSMIMSASLGDRAPRLTANHSHASLRTSRAAHLVRALERGRPSRPAAACWDRRLSAADSRAAQSLRRAAANKCPGTFPATS